MGFELGHARDDPLEHLAAVQLVLHTAVARVSYRVGGVIFWREVFASHPDNVFVVHLHANQPGKITFIAKFDSPHEKVSIQSKGGDQLLLRGDPWTFQYRRMKDKFECVLRFEVVTVVEAFQ